MDIRALALDPGVTTGYADAIVEDVAAEIDVGERKFSCLDLWYFLQDREPTHIIYESFEFRKGKSKAGVQLFSRNMIGVITLYCEMQNATPHQQPVKMYSQTAGKGKGYFDNDRLKEYGVYVRGKEHGRDATRHLMQWFMYEAGYQFKLEKFILAQGQS